VRPISQKSQGVSTNFFVFFLGWLVGGPILFQVIANQAIVANQAMGFLGETGGGNENFSFFLNVFLVAAGAGEGRRWGRRRPTVVVEVGTRCGASVSAARSAALPDFD
jgi:hypothetical protein